jgi:hypothetical protein
MNGGEAQGSCVKERLKAKQCAIRGDSTTGYMACAQVFPCVAKEGQTDVEAICEAYRDNSITGSLDAVIEAKLFKEIKLCV